MEVQNLFKEYAGKQVLEDVNFKVKNGEIFVLVGPNGAGKTTLLRILDLLEEPTRGKVMFDGENVDYTTENKTALRRKIGMVFQQTLLFNASVFDNVAYGLKVRGEKGDIEQKVKEALELVQLHGFETKNALTLSGGEAQRVALAQAIITSPQLLLLDEPTANLDPRNVSIIEQVLSSVNQEKKTTIIMTTHNLHQAENLAQQVAVLNEGKIEEVGTYQEIFWKPTKAAKNFARLENVFLGISKISAEGTSVIDVGEGVQIEAAAKQEGHVMFHVPPEDIILSTSPIVSSARNVFEGKIIQLSDLESVVKLRVRAKKDFVVQITKRSFNEMRLNIDSRVFLAFKASSVQLKPSSKI
ncbi:MAG: ATP-binding cassette domain-containing protein [Candidatus Bathyarchaeia archaeon]